MSGTRTIRWFARIFFDDNFVVNNVTILQGKDKLFVEMPSYKTKQYDEQGKTVYQDDIVNITLHFFLKDIRPMQHPVMNHSTAVA